MMDLQGLIGRMRGAYKGFNAPADAGTLDRLQEAVGPLPQDALELYRDHDGSDAPLTGEDDASLPARLLPAEEAIAARAFFTRL
jgi:cell wall assembly regulator SMI1